MGDDISLGLLAAAALAGDAEAPAVRDGERWYDWGWLRDTGAAAIDLLGPPSTGDRPIGLVARNRPIIVAVLLALIAQGRSVRMIYAHQSARMLADEIAAGGLCALIAADEDVSSPVADAARGANIRVIAAHEDIGIGPVNAPDPDGGAAGQDPTPPYIEVLTSGTTGPPRHFRISHDMLLKRLLSMNVTYSRRSAGRSKGVSLIFYPLGTISGLYSFLPLALDRRPVILQEKFDVDGWLAFIDKHRPSRSSLPPFGIETLLERRTPRQALAGLKFIGTGAAPLDVQTQTDFEEHFGVPLLVSYGATEFGGPVAAMTSAIWKTWGASKRGSAGQAWAGAKLRIVDPASGAEQPPGKVGVLEVVPPGAEDGEWVRTADRATIDLDGFLHHRGRADGAITRGGFSILPEVIEAAIVRHPEVVAAAVVALAHRRLGEVPAAAIRPRDFDAPPSPDALEAHLRDHVFSTHIPVQYRFVRQLPMNGSMKVDQAQVRALFDRKPRNE